MTRDEKALAGIAGGSLLLFILSLMGPKREAPRPPSARDGGLPPAEDGDQEDGGDLPPAEDGSAVERGDVDVLSDADIPPPLRKGSGKNGKGSGKKTKKSPAAEDRLWRETAVAAYQKATAAGYPHPVAAAKALDLYLNQGGNNAATIEHWQRQLGVTPTGVADNETTTRLEDLL